MYMKLFGVSTYSSNDNKSIIHYVILIKYIHIYSSTSRESRSFRYDLTLAIYLTVYLYRARNSLLLKRKNVRIIFKWTTLKVKK